MDAQKQQVIDKVKLANNVLVTVSSNPSVDQLAACLGLTLALNKLGKHATAVFSGAVPSTIEFLQPEKTIEKTTDSLRDFIIALDKSKADKLRYKVEDKIVKIFITPYHTSLGEADLEFSQGDFNVDVVLALGIHNPADVDQAITAHGRILHDATVATVNIKPGGELGSINWLDARSSSLCELVWQLVSAIDKRIVDGQIATSLLTGIVAETQRFSNAKTFPQTMSASAELMAAGANQQLVVTKLEAAQPPPAAVSIAQAQPGGTLAQATATPGSTAAQSDEGALRITHLEELNKPDDTEKKEDSTEEAPAPQINIDTEGTLHRLGANGAATVDPAQHMQGSHMVLQPPSLGGQLSANTGPGIAAAPTEFGGGAPLGSSPILQHATPGSDLAPSQNPTAHTYLDPAAMPLSSPAAAAPMPGMPVGMSPDALPSGAPYAPPQDPLMPGSSSLPPIINPPSSPAQPLGTLPNNPSPFGPPPSNPPPPVPPPMMPPGVS